MDITYLNDGYDYIHYFVTIQKHNTVILKKHHVKKRLKTLDFLKTIVFKLRK